MNTYICYVLMIEVLVIYLCNIFLYNSFFLMTTHMENVENHPLFYYFFFKEKFCLNTKLVHGQTFLISMSNDLIFCIYNKGDNESYARICAIIK